MIDRKNSTSAPNTHAEHRKPVRGTGVSPARKSAESAGNACSPRKPTAPVRNDGQRRLLALGLTVRDIASRVGASVSTVHAWMSAASTPGYETAEKLEQTLGIPRHAWEVQPDYVGALRDAVRALDDVLAAAEARLEAVYEAMRGLR